MSSFIESMPVRYRAQTDDRAAHEHARIATQRGKALASAGLFPSLEREGSGICVVARDEPGLLALISAAIVICGLDVLEAEAYNRNAADGSTEAVDLFWVRHIYPRQLEPLTLPDIVEFRDTLVELLSGHERPGISQRRPDSLTPAASETSVRFIEDAEGCVITLEVETRDRSGLLLAVTEALFKERVQIVGSRISTRGGRVYDRFELVEFDGSPIAKERRGTLQLAILAAVDRGGTPSIAAAG